MYGDTEDNDNNGWNDDVHGIDLVNRDGDPRDDSHSGHGTMVAGAIAAVGRLPKFISIAGAVGRNIRLMPLKVLDALGEGYVSFVFAATEYAIKYGASILALLRFDNSSKRYTTRISISCE